MFAAFLERRSDPKLEAWGRGDDLVTGDRNVNVNTALQLLAVSSSVRFISDEVSQLPVDVYRETDAGKVEVSTPGWLQNPNADMNIQEFVGQFVASLLLDGNFYGLIVRDRLGYVAEVWPLRPDLVQPLRLGYGEPITYYVMGRPFTGELMHVKAFSLPGEIKGRDPIADARQAIGLGLTLQEFGANFFENGVSPSIVISAQGGPDTVDAGKIRDQIDKMHRGTKKSHGALVLTGGMTASPLSISPENAQFIETRSFTETQIAHGIFGVPPQMIGLSAVGRGAGQDITYQNIDQRWIELVRRAFMPWITRFDAAMSSLLPGRQCVKINVDGYLRADLATRYQSYLTAAQIQQITGEPLITMEEMREFEDLGPLPERPTPTPQVPQPLDPTGVSPPLPAAPPSS